MHERHAPFEARPYGIFLSDIDALAMCGILQAIKAGKDTESYGDEAQTILDSIEPQIKKKFEE